jgi:hypothetical protein
LRQGADILDLALAILVDRKAKIAPVLEPVSRDSGQLAVEALSGSQIGQVAK